MGYNSTASTITLTARLTPIGRQRLVSTNNALIKTFSLGDSDANYNTDLTLSSGEMPGFGGALGVGSGASNSTTSSIDLSSRLIVNPTGTIFKAVSPKSSTIITQTNPLGSKIIASPYITINYVNRNDLTTDPLVNLYQTFGFTPISSNAW